MTAQIIAVQLFDLIVFGGTGDLAQRKLMPALFHRDCDGQLPSDSRIIGISRRDYSEEAYRSLIEQAIREHVDQHQINEGHLTRFLDRLSHIMLDATGNGGWTDLKSLLEGQEDRVRVFYLATAPRLFGDICRRIGEVGLNSPETRVVLEKPIGQDLASAKMINDSVGQVFDEHQIFRIDHYLGKETVQNLMALRFANSLFEPLWNSSAVDHVQITVAESIGVEGRGGYYDKSGALRDMVQNHILQLLCLVAMEAPTCFTADAVRDEKLKVLRALKPITDASVAQKTVRGQYKAGSSNGHPVSAYRDEIDSSDGSLTETFVGLKAEIENWRWAGVPFYLRTGKRLSMRTSEIVVHFKKIPHSIFNVPAESVTANRLIVRLQPDEGMELALMAKDPGPGGMRLRDVALNLSFAETFKVRYPDAYERLLMDVVRGNPTLFMRRDEVEAAWSWIEPILVGWEQQREPPKTYAAGTWGPTAAIALIERDGRTWYEG